MDYLRTQIINTLKAKFPAMGDNIKAYADVLDEQTEPFVGYPAGSIFVSILPLQSAPEEFAPWELRANWGIVVTGKGASKMLTDAEGWHKTIQVAEVIYSNKWGMKHSVTPAVITGIQKNEQRNKDNYPTGVYYWTITFYNLIRFTAALGTPEY